MTAGRFSSPLFLKWQRYRRTAYGCIVALAVRSLSGMRWLPGGLFSAWPVLLVTAVGMTESAFFSAVFGFVFGLVVDIGAVSSPFGWNGLLWLLWGSVVSVVFARWLPRRLVAFFSLGVVGTVLQLTADALWSGALPGYLWRFGWRTALGGILAAPLIFFLSGRCRIDTALAEND